MSPEDPSQPNLNKDEFEQAIEIVERALIDLKARYTQVQQDQQKRSELQERQQELKQQQKNKQNKTREPIKTELRHIQQELEQIELNLESRLFHWGCLKEPFWQAVRFGGIGIILGWILHWLTR